MKILWCLGSKKLCLGMVAALVAACALVRVDALFIKLSKFFN